MTAAGAAAAAAALPVSSAAGAPSPPPLPPPLNPDAFRERQSKLKAAARAQAVDALIVTPSANLAYAANIGMGASERLTALLLFSEGPATLLTPSFEEANVRRDAVVEDVVTWKEEEDPIALAARLLSRAKTIGIEGSTPYGTVARLLAATSLRPQDATPIFDALRRIKTEEEQAFIREAARRTNLAIEATHKKMSRGVTELEVAEILEREFQRLGVHGGGLVQFGPSSALPHGGPGERRLASGDVVLIDCGCRVRGYTSDITRTVAYGVASDELRKVYAVVDRAQVAGIGALRGGVSGAEADRAARKVIEDAGYGASFTHRLGHGLGLDGHESPYLVSGNTAPLAAGNTVTVEPGIYLSGKFGVRIEDDYAVRETSPPASLSTRPADLVIVPA
jgi:Xaa-Pro dipeptidase